jgi:hypothetical protein
MKTRWLAAVGVVVVVAVAGWYYTRQRPPAEARGPRDPALATLISLGVLERNPDTRLSKEQIATILPMLQALRDVPATDVAAAAALARSIREAFTPAQVAALQAARERFAGRAPGPQDGSARPAAPFGVRQGRPGGASEGQRAQFRARAFDRMIQALQRRME